MAYKQLGKLAPANTTAATLYTVPGATETVVSSIFVANLTSSPVEFDIAIIPSGDTLSSENYIYFNITLPGKDTFVSTTGIALAAGDVINVKTYEADALAFQAYGTEIS